MIQCLESKLTGPPSLRLRFIWMTSNSLIFPVTIHGGGGGDGWTIVVHCRCNRVNIL